MSQDKDLYARGMEFGGGYSFCRRYKSCQNLSGLKVMAKVKLFEK